MGQQQLLLLVLSTVIVGLATVAGIQAFDEGQTQAASDALVQRATQIGTDIYAAHQEPDQLGGIDATSDSKEAIAASAGYGDNGPTGIPADGAGGDYDCDIAQSSSVTTVTCESGTSGEDQSVVVTVDPNSDPSVTTTEINGQSV